MTREGQTLRRLVLGYRLSQAIFVVAKLGVADLVAQEPKSVDALGLATGANPDFLFRVLRLLASEGVFSEHAPRTFGMTPLAVPLLTGAPDMLRYRAIFDGEQLNWTAWGCLLKSVLEGGSSIRHAFGEELFDYLSEDSTSAESFDVLMAAQTKATAQMVVDAYDQWVGTVIDVGGGYGALLEAIVERRPEVSGILFDLPHVLAKVGEKADSVGFRERIALKEGDFFQSVPQGGNVYVLKYILHDWNDTECERILRNCRRTVAKGSRLLVIEVLIPSGAEYHYGKYLDLNMLVLTRGRERTEGEYRALVGQCGFTLVRIIEAGSELSIMECI